MFGCVSETFRADATARSHYLLQNTKLVKLEESQPAVNYHFIPMATTSMTRHHIVIDKCSVHASTGVGGVIEKPVYSFPPY